MPARQRLPPLAGHFGKYADAVADLFGALVVVRRGREHGVRPVLRAVGAERMKLLDVEAELVWLAAHLVERAERKVAIERSVFHALGRDRRAELLKAHGEPAHALGQFSRCVVGGFAAQRAAHESEDGAVGIEALAFGGHRWRRR
jgi:hypothetical protein